MRKIRIPARDPDIINRAILSIVVGFALIECVATGREAGTRGGDGSSATDAATSPFSSQMFLISIDKGDKGDVMDEVEVMKGVAPELFSPEDAAAVMKLPDQQKADLEALGRYIKKPEAQETGLQCELVAIRHFSIPAVSDQSIDHYLPIGEEEALLLDRRFGKLQQTSRPKKREEIFYPDPMASVHTQTHFLAFSQTRVERRKCEDAGLLFRTTINEGDSLTSKEFEAYRLDSRGDVTWMYRIFDNDGVLALSVVEVFRGTSGDRAVNKIRKRRLEFDKGSKGAGLSVWSAVALDPTPPNRVPK